MSDHGPQKQPSGVHKIMAEKKQVDNQVEAAALREKVANLEDGIQSLGALLFVGCKLEYKDDYRWHIIDPEDGSDVVEPHVSLISVVVSAKDKFDNNGTAAGEGA